MRTSTRLVFLVVLSFLAASAALAQGDSYLPQVANGQAGGFMLRTTFVLLNPTSGPVGVEIALTRGDNEEMTVVIPDLGPQASDSFSISLQQGETRFLQTDGLGDLAVGAARVTTSGPAEVSALFTISDTAGRFITEAGVGTSQPMTRFVIPVDVSGPFNTGLAVFNPNLSGTPVTLSLVDTSGTAAESREETLKGGEHRALFISELFPRVSSFRGTLVVSSDRSIAAVALRQNQATLTSTTFPVAGSGSSIIESQLPQVANGRAGDEVMRTTFILFNVSAASNTVELRLTSGDDGGPFPVRLTGAASASSQITRTLPPGGSAFLQTDGTGDLMVGAAGVKSDYPIGVVAIFSLYDLHGNFLTEAGVGDSPALSTFSIPVDTLGDADTGLALYNPGGTSVTGTVRLLDEEGRLVQSVPLDPQLSPRGHRALLVRPTFENRRLRGSLSITANGKLAALTVRMNTLPLSYTTLPRASGAFSGFIVPPSLLALNQSGVDASADATVNVVLPMGLRLSGTVTGAAGSVKGILARAETGEVYQGVVNPWNRRYWIALPPGVYRLVLFYSPATEVLMGAPVMTFEDPMPVTVSADGTRDLDLPGAEIFTVSGRLQDLGKAFGASLYFMSDDGRVSAQAFINMDGDYTVRLPSGSYSISLVMNRIQQGPSLQDLAAWNFASVTVGGAPLANHNLTVPQTRVVQGNVTAMGLTELPAGSYISFRDRSAPEFGHLVFMDPVASSTATTGAEGAYRAVLPSFRSYDAEAHIRFGGGHLHVPAGQPLQVNADAVHLGLEVQELPAATTISGRVTAPDGSGHPGVTVEVRGSPPAWEGGAYFTGRTTTNLSGDYQISVPAGTYEVLFVP
jgi:hypothetical protein